MNLFARFLSYQCFYALPHVSNKDYHANLNHLYNNLSKEIVNFLFENIDMK